MVITCILGVKESKANQGQFCGCSLRLKLADWTGT